MTTKKSKNFPIKVWLDQDSCRTEKPQGEGYTEYVRVDYHSQALLHVLKKGSDFGKKEMLERVCEYIKENLYHAWINTNNGNTYRTQSTELFIKNLKKAMEG